MKYVTPFFRTIFNRKKTIVRIAMVIGIMVVFACNPKKIKNTVDIPESKSKVDTVNMAENKSSIDSVINSKAAIDTTKTLNKKALETPTKEETIAKPIENKAKKKTISKATRTAIKTTSDVSPQPKEKITEEIGAPAVKKEKISTTPNHDLWNILTKKYVSSSGKVNYVGFKKEIPTINAYLIHLEKTTPNQSWSREEKLAYWFNLYNAATVYLVASNYPINSIRDLENGKPWDKKFVKSGVKVLSLNEIENTLVRPHYNEPRLHVAFNCAAVSCPNLLNEAFVANKLDEQLHTLSKLWISDSSKNHIAENEIQISKIFQWYQEDFKKGVIPFINNYSRQKINSNATVTYLDYNWKLND